MELYLFVLFGILIVVTVSVLVTIFKYEDLIRGQYPTSKNWIEWSGTVEYKGSIFRLKPSYQNSKEFTDKLSKIIKERTNGI